ncbi:hypothetical protein CEXT_613771 [Caerostris extrusa]|uniref:Uncharacterized protein n=1 Tax=Caerostris extrusa TaxID=172846 RepID=A0AAV4NCZ2_CAEEX|nr:hypothetical protein CEXT_613771 [Caerostris extrusa]
MNEDSPVSVTVTSQRNANFSVFAVRLTLVELGSFFCQRSSLSACHFAFCLPEEEDVYRTKQPAQSYVIILLKCGTDLFRAASNRNAFRRIVRFYT